MTENFERIWWNVMVGLATVFLVVGLAGCSAAGGRGHEVRLPVEAPCDDSFWPEAGHEEELQAAVEIWSEALGRDVCLHESGVPVFWEEQVYVDTKEFKGYVCGETSIEYNADGTFAYPNYVLVAIAQGNCERRHTLLHELGHALSHRNYTDSKHTLSSGSMMHEYNSPSVELDPESIDFVCERSGC